MFINFGDRNFFEYGILIDSEHSDTEFKILYCRPFDDAENLFYFADCEVNITENWLDKKSIMEYIGMTEENFDAALFAVGCVEYYGAENFSSPYDGYMFTAEEIKERLKYYLIANDNLDITW